MPKRQVRRVYLAKQVADHSGPVMEPDVVDGQHLVQWTHADRAMAYNTRLARSSYAKPWGKKSCSNKDCHRVSASRCFHRDIPSDCLVIDGVDDPFVDIVVNFGCPRYKQSVVMVRYLLSPELKPNYLPNFGCEELAMITQYNSTVRKAKPIASANREDHGDVGIMHVIGAKTLRDGYTIGEYTFGNTVTPELTRGFVRALSRIGSVVYPDVLAVIQDSKGDAGFQLPPKTMAGDKYGNCVGGKIDMSVDMTNASYVDMKKMHRRGFVSIRKKSQGSLTGGIM